MSKSRKITNKRIRKHYRKSKVEVQMLADKNTVSQKNVSFQENTNIEFENSELGEAHRNLEDMTNRIVAQRHGNIFD